MSVIKVKEGACMKNRIIAYSYLATLSNSNRNEEYLSIFKDMVKYAIFEAGKKSKEFLIGDVQEKIKEIYDLNMPYAVVEFIIQHNIDKEEILLTTDGAIITKNLNLDDYYLRINQSEYDITFLEEDFIQFLKENGIETKYSIFDLVDVYRDRLLIDTYKEDQISDTYRVQMKYLSMIENDISRNRIFQNLLIGALITVTILDGRHMQGSFKGNTLLLDTSFIISLLGLHSDISNETCQLVGRIACNLGFEFKVFDQTMQEASNLLKDTADKLRNDRSLTLIVGNEITKSCYLNPKINANDLDRIAANLSEELENKIKFSIILIEKFRLKVEHSNLYNYYLNVYKKDPISAFHDTAAIIYVESCRGINISSIDKAKCWFVQDKRNSSNGIRNKNGSINERISSHDLLVLLWMNSPEGMNLQQVSEIEFMRMISIAKTTNSPKICDIEKFEENFKKYCNIELKPQELARLRMGIINASFEEIEYLNNVEPVIFDEKIRDIINKQKLETTEQMASYEYELDQKNEIINEKEILTELLTVDNKSKDNEIREKDKLINQFRNKQIEELKQLRTERTNCINNISIHEENNEKILNRTSKLKKTLMKFNLIILVCSIGILCFAVYNIYVDNSVWIQIEPWTWVIGSSIALLTCMINNIITYINFIFNKSFKNMIDVIVDLYNKYLEFMYKDPSDKLNVKKEELDKLDRKIEAINENYDIS